MLPDNCGGCIYWKRGGTLCRRHAPSPSNQPREVAHWPLTTVTDRCGSGSDGEDDDARFVRCGRCIHWYQPEGKPVPMAERRGVPPKWWEASGFCTRYAPSRGRHEVSKRTGALPMRTTAVVMVSRWWSQPDKDSLSPRLYPLLGL